MRCRKAGSEQNKNEIVKCSVKNAQIRAQLAGQNPAIRASSGKSPGRKSHAELGNRSGIYECQYVHVCGGGGKELNPDRLGLHYITLHYTTLHYITLHYTTLHYITLHYTTLHFLTIIIY